MSMIAPVFHRVRSTCAIPFYPPNIPQDLRRIDDDDETGSSKGREDSKGIERREIADVNNAVDR